MRDLGHICRAVVMRRECKKNRCLHQSNRQIEQTDKDLLVRRGSHAGMIFRSSLKDRQFNFRRAVSVQTSLADPVEPTLRFGSAGIVASIVLAMTDRDCLSALKQLRRPTSWISLFTRETN